VKKTVIFFLFITVTTLLFPAIIKQYEKAKVIDIISTIKPLENETDIFKKENIALKIKSGKYKDKNIIVENKIYKNQELNLNIKRDSNLIIEIEDNKGIISYKIVEHDKSIKMIIFLVLVIILAGVLFEWNGIKSIIYFILFLIITGGAYFSLFEKGAPVIITGIIFLMALLFLYVLLFKKSKNEKKIIMAATTIPFFLFLIVNSILISIFKIKGFSTSDILTNSDLLRRFNLRDGVNISILFTIFAILLLISTLIADNLERNRESYSNVKEIFKGVMEFGEKIYGALIFFVTIFTVGVSYFEYMVFYMKNSSADWIMFFNSEYIVITLIRYFLIITAIAVAVPFNGLYGAKVYGEEK
jgi:uncharacterized membrane protein